MYHAHFVESPNWLFRRFDKSLLGRAHLTGPVRTKLSLKR
jgi:hypothetical protein